MSVLMNFEKKNEALVHEKYLRLELVEKIFELMEKKGFTQSKLAKKMDLSKSQISRLLADDRNLTITSIAKLFAALGEELSVMTKTEAQCLQKGKTKTETVVHLVEVPYQKMPLAYSGNFSGATTYGAVTWKR